MREYLMGVLCAALICSIVSSIGGAGQGTRKLLCGVFMALALLHPVGSLDLPELSIDPILDEAADAAQAGQSMAQAARTDVISDALEAYILTKAQELDLPLTAELTLDSDGLPAGLILSGPASPSEREQFTNAITQALGLGKEDVTWKDTYQSCE